MNDKFSPARPPRGGFVLVVVLIVIAMLSFGGYAFSELMLAEHKAARLQGESVQARALAQSGVELASAYLSLPAKERQEFGGHLQNPERFQGVVVMGGEAGERVGRVTLIAPPRVEETPPKLRFGLATESSRLNLATLLDWEAAQPGAARAALLNLPAMTEDLADAILDWIDADDAPREFGAESEHYDKLEPAYSPPNRVPATLDELLWVRGVTRALLYGEDRNRNGYVDAHELDLADPARDQQKSSGPFGWATYLTLASAEGGAAAGQAKIDLNSDDLKKLYDDLLRALDQEAATFIVAYRQFGPYAGPAANSDGQPLPPDLELPAKFRIESVLDLIAARVQVAHPNLPPLVLPSPFASERAAMQEYLPRLSDLTTTASGRVVGRINVNEAPREVLMGVPGIGAGLVEDIISKRGREPEAISEERRHVTWLLTEGLVELEQMKQLAKYLTAGGDVFRAQTIGYLADGPICRAEFVLDATEGRARLVSWIDLERLGRGYDYELLGNNLATNSRPNTPTP